VNTIPPKKKKAICRECKFCKSSSGYRFLASCSKYKSVFGIDSVTGKGNKYGECHIYNKDGNCEAWEKASLWQKFRASW
jgi:coenzyme F420-reducing hydrogenase delta subunit